MRSQPRHAAPRAPRGRLLHALGPRRQPSVPSSPRHVARRVAAALSAAPRTVVGVPASLRAAWRARPLLSAERRRARTLVAGAVVVAAVVLLTSFPLSEVLGQRSALAATTRQLAAYQSADRVLGDQVAALEQPGAAGTLARRDYGFVPAGDQAFEILPAPGSSAPSSTQSGFVPLDAPPVVPGSARSQALIGAPPAPAAAVRHAAHRARAITTAVSGGRPGTGPGPSYWGRVLRSLEFWN